MDKWIKIKYPTEGYINSEELKGKNIVILITYQTRTGKKYVKAVNSNHGKLSGRINGIPIAFMFLPDPFEEE